MESSAASVLNELARVNELARKLGDSLRQPSQIEHCRTIAEEIIFSVEKAICTAKSAAGGGESRLSDCRGQYSGDQQVLKKRKMLPTWTGQVSASTLRGSEGLLPADGHSWRKYGQKDILKAKHPRAYYRCTHRRRQGCQAMKQVQRSDDNPWVFEVTYRGTHTCSGMVQLQPNSRALDETLAFEAQDSTSSILFPSTPLNPEEDDLFCSSPNLERCFQASFPSAFMSPTTSESNRLPCQKISHGNPSPDLTDIISMATSMTNPTMADADFMLRTGEMDTYFPIETLNCFEPLSGTLQYDCLLSS